MSLDGKGKPERLFFDRGHDRHLVWSPDGSKLAFVSNRGDHAFIGIYEAKTKPLIYLAPTSNIDREPGLVARWKRDRLHARAGRWRRARTDPRAQDDAVVDLDCGRIER